MSEYLRKTRLFKDLTDEQLRKISSRGEERRIPEDEHVFREGEVGHELFVVMDGRIQISVEMSLPTEQAPVHTVTSGSVFGEFALVSDHERSASALALRETMVFALSREAFRDLAEEDPRLDYLVLHELGQILVGRLIKTTKELRASLMF